MHQEQIAPITHIPFADMAETLTRRAARNNIYASSF
jgi:hypothetical protein